MSAAVDLEELALARHAFPAAADRGRNRVRGCRTEALRMVAA
jgi:hypothetical protein